MEALVREIPYKSKYSTTPPPVRRTETSSLPDRAALFRLQHFRGQQAHLYSKANHIATRPKSECLSKSRTISLDGFHPHQNLFGDLLTAVAPRHKFEHLQITVAQDIHRPCATGFDAFFRKQILDSIFQSE